MTLQTVLKALERVPPEAVQETDPGFGDIFDTDDPNVYETERYLRVKAAIEAEKRHPICGRLKGDGTLCRNIAGKGTTHTGAPGSRCRKHKGNDGPLKHGKYSEHVTQGKQFKEIVQEYEKLTPEEALSLTHEIAVLRAALNVAEEQGDQDIQQFITDRGFFIQGLTQSIGALIERKQRIEKPAQQHIHINLVGVMMEQLVAIVAEEVSDERVIGRVIQRFGKELTLLRTPKALGPGAGR